MEPVHPTQATEIGNPLPISANGGLTPPFRFAIHEGHSIKVPRGASFELWSEAPIRGRVTGCTFYKHQEYPWAYVRIAVWHLTRLLRRFIRATH